MRNAFHHIVRQQTDFQLWRSIFSDAFYGFGYGLQVTEQDMLDGLFAVSDPDLVRQQGFSLLNIKHYVEQVGMRGRGYQVEIDTLKDIQIPTIVLLDLKGYKHFCRAEKDNRRPGIHRRPRHSENKIMPKDEFVASWNGVVFAVIGKGFNRYSVLLNPPPPLYRQKSVECILPPLTDAQLLEHGFYPCGSCFNRPIREEIPS